MKYSLYVSLELFLLLAPGPAVAAAKPETAGQILAQLNALVEHLLI